LHPGIWRAWDPSRAVLYFTRTGNFDALSGVLLAVTGCEALFANLGQLGQRGIQIPLILIVYPSLMLAYLGQGAQLIVNGPTVIPNVFYLSIPGGAGGALYWIGFATGLLATIIASQAMLTASFSIISQLVHFKSFPSVKQKYPSDDYGQSYIPVVNYIMGAAIIGVVAGFATSTKLTNAYGFAVATVMIVTTSEVALSIYFVKRKSIILAVVFFAFFGFVDCLLWGSTWHKIPEGAWFSFGVGLLLASFMWLWTWLTSLIEHYDRDNRLVLNQLISEIPQESKEKGSFQKALTLHGLDNVDRRLNRSDSFAVFWKPSSGNGVPHSFSQFLTKYPSCPSVVIFLSVKILAVPSIPARDSVVVRRVRQFPGFYTATLRQGYKDHLHLKELNEQLFNHIRQLERMAASSNDQVKSTIEYLTETKKTFTHIYPSYYPAARPIATSIYSMDHLTSGQKVMALLSPRVLCGTTHDIIRGFFIEDFFRRLKGAFAEEDGPVSLI
jgi:KUP system potassium uptake protein